MNWLRTALAELPPPDRASGDLVRERAADILRPAGALARSTRWPPGWPSGRAHRRPRCSGRPR
jgi:hypothetical protein